MIKPWRLVESKFLGDFRVFSVRSDLKESPRTGTLHEFFVLDCVHWVNIVPVTPAGELVMVEQFRHGSGTVELELPGGIMDPGDHSPLETARRELLEETGYEGHTPQFIGQVFSNPAILTNTTYTVVIENCVWNRAPQFDAAEDLNTRLVPISEVFGLVAQGKIKHSLVVAALLHFHLWKRL